MKWSIEVIEPKYFAANVADEVLSILNEAIDEHGFASLALAGGSTPAETYRVLSKPPRVSEVEWTKVKAFLGDERWVPLEHSQSNYKMVSETLLMMIPENGLSCFPMVHEGASSKEGAKRCGEAIEAALRRNSEGVPVFDLILLGLGEDGHTASIFPGSEALSPEAPTCLSVTHPIDGTERVTLSANVIKAADRIVCIVKGEGKSEILQTVLESTTEPNVHPAQILRDANGTVMWFVDSFASKRLSSSTV